MGTHIAAKLGVFGTLADEEVDELDRTFGLVKTIPAGHKIVSDGDRPAFVLGFQKGWAARCKLLQGGSRQIIDLLLPGDVATLSEGTGARIDFTVIALTPVDVTVVPFEAYSDLLRRSPAIDDAMRYARVADEGLLRSAVVRLGRLDAFHRVGHFMCETWCRADNAKLIIEGRLPFPLTQVDVSDILGLTSVHLNRTLRSLRQDGLLTWQSRKLHIPDVYKLAKRVGYAGSLPCEASKKAAA